MKTIEADAKRLKEASRDYCAQEPLSAVAGGGFGVRSIPLRGQIQ
jgi:hypothetical protein